MRFNNPRTIVFGPGRYDLLLTRPPVTQIICLWLGFIVLVLSVIDILIVCAMKSAASDFMHHSFVRTISRRFDIEGKPTSCSGAARIDYVPFQLGDGSARASERFEGGRTEKRVIICFFGTG